MVRPHRVAIAPIGGEGVTGTVMRAIFAGDILQYDVEVAGQTVSVELATRGGETVLAPGTAVCLSWRPQDVFVYGAAP
jgi:putative spermidine/putrescine transport system ATP-binding protein